MGYSIWKTNRGVITFGADVNVEDVLKHYDEAEPAKPRFIKRNEQPSMPREFVKDFTDVVRFFGCDDEEIAVRKKFCREYPDLAISGYSALAADLRGRPEFGITQRIKEATNAAKV